MTTTYPKTYILERINAREVSLRARQERIAAEASDLAEDINEALAVWVEDIRVAAYDAMSASVLNLDDARAVKDRLLEAAKVPLPGQGSLSVFKEDDSRGDELIRRQRAANLDQSQWARDEEELGRIAHVRAYLEGTPVDEFTLTQVKTLGLLDFVKFDLARAKGEA